MQPCRPQSQVIFCFEHIHKRSQKTMTNAQNLGRPSTGTLLGRTVRQTRKSTPPPRLSAERDDGADRTTEGVAVLDVGATLLRCEEVLRRIGLRRTALYALIKAGKFPAPVKLGGASAWVDIEITRWIENLMLVRDRRANSR